MRQKAPSGQSSISIRRFKAVSGASNTELTGSFFPGFPAHFAHVG
jgi:hypothetical protein